MQRQLLTAIVCSILGIAVPALSGAADKILTLNGKVLTVGGQVLTEPSQGNGGFIALTSWPILNTAGSPSPANTYAEYALRFPVGQVPSGSEVVVKDSGGNSIPITIGQKTTWPDGSLKIAAVWSRHSSIPSGGSQQLTIGYDDGVQDTAYRRSIIDVQNANIGIAFTGVKGATNTANDGSGSFHCRANDMGLPISHPLSGPVVDLYVYGGYASDDAGGSSKHMYCKFYVWMPTKSDGTADAPRVIAEVRQEDFNNPAANGTPMDLMQMHATLSIGGTSLRTYDVGVNADGTQCKPNCIGMQAASGWWTANTNGMPFWAANGAAQDAIYAQQDEAYNRSSKIGMPYDLEGTNLATKTRTVDVYSPYSKATTCGWSQETGTGAHSWIQPAPVWDTDRIFANTVSYWQQSNVCTLLGTSYAGGSWIDATSQRIPNVMPTAYQSPPNPNYGMGAPGFPNPLGASSANTTTEYTNGGSSGIYSEDFSHYPSGLAFQTYLHSGDYHLLDVALERVGGGLFAGFSNGVNLRNLTLDGIDYYGLNVTAGNFRAIGWRMAAVANVWTMLPDDAPEKPYLLDANKQQVDYMNAYYADNPAMAALGLWAVSQNYRTYQEAQFMNNYVVYGIIATDQLMRGVMPESSALVGYSLKHYTDSLLDPTLGPTFVAISQGLSPWTDRNSATSWPAPEDLGFSSTGAAARNIATFSITPGSNMLAIDARTDLGNRNIHPMQCDKLYLRDTGNNTNVITLPTGLSVGGPYYVTNVNSTNPAIVTFQISATCNGAPIAFDGSTMKYANGTSGNTNYVPGYALFGNTYMRISVTNNVSSLDCVGNIEGEFHGLMTYAQAMGYNGAAAAKARLDSDPGPLIKSNCSVNGADRRWDIRAGW